MQSLIERAKDVNLINDKLIETSPPLRKTISVPIGYTPSQFKTFDSELIQKLDQRHSISDRHSGNFRYNFRSNQSILDDKEEMENIKKSHDDGLNEI